MGFLILLIMIAIMLSIAALILKLACTVFNAMAGGSESPGAVPMPGFGKAVGLVILVGIMGIASQFLLLKIGLISETTSPIMGLGLTLVVPFLVTATMYTALLPTTFARGLGVAACQYVIYILIYVVLLFTVLAALLSVFS